MLKKAPFHLRLRKLTHPTPRRIYRFRRRIKRLQAYLLLYVFPQTPPSAPPIETLYKQAGKLRQAYLIRKAAEDFSPTLIKKAQKQVRKRKRRFLKAYRLHKAEAKKILREWADRFPVPAEEAFQRWHMQGHTWLQSWKAPLSDFPLSPYTPERWHDLRGLLRTWEMAAYWVKLPEIPPPGLTDYLGKARDHYILYKWLVKQGSPPSLQDKIKRKYRKYEQKALETWQNWRLSWD
ncbi:MAG: hypothetical protein N3A68_04100 [Bacteroidia bacterium]|nr:hypothetical protein [Bacteroidia bacterium]